MQPWFISIILTRNYFNWHTIQLNDVNRESEKPFFFDSLEQDIEKFIDLLQKHITSEYVVVFLFFCFVVVVVVLMVISVIKLALFRAFLTD